MGHQYMQRCLDLALLGAGYTSPNPMVGAVIVCDDKIIGEGFTSPYGGPHAEVNAVKNAIALLGEQIAKERFKSSTIYVSLEPCAHHGKTPPCADMIVANQFRKVVIACQDPFSKVNGAGIAKLKNAGIEVEVGLMQQEAQWLNRRFFTRIGKYRPYVILKWAETGNQYFAPLEATQKWISNTASKQLSHQWRTEEDAILVGTKTALVDNPSLTSREWEGRNPKRILIDKDLVVPETSNIFNKEAETIVFNAKKTDWQGHVKWLEVENFDLYLPQNILYQLYLMDVQSLLIEGGANTLKMFIEAGLWDEVRIFRSTQHWDDGAESPLFNGVLIHEANVGDDRLLVYRPEN